MHEGKSFGVDEESEKFYVGLSEDMKPVYVKISPTDLSVGTCEGNLVFGKRHQVYSKHEAEDSYYYCNSCGLELNGSDADEIKVGRFLGNGEFTNCPNCSYENSIYRSEEEC